MSWDLLTEGPRTGQTLYGFPAVRSTIAGWYVRWSQKIGQVVKVYSTV